VLGSQYVYIDKVNKM